MTRERIHCEACGHRPELGHAGETCKKQLAGYPYGQRCGGRLAELPSELRRHDPRLAYPSYPKKADYPDDYPYEVVVVERDDAGNVKHVEVVSRHSLRSVAEHLLSTQRGNMTANPRFTAELVTPTGMESA